MAENNFGKGIKITSGFDLGAKSPLDNRSVVNTLEERDAHVTNNRAYEGMKVYVAETKKEYIFIDNEWVSASNQEGIEAIIDLEKIETSDIEPVDETVSIWINTSEDTVTGTVAKINDEVISDSTTWSSEKINASIVFGSSSGTVDLRGYALKTELPTKVSQLTNDKNYLSSIPSEYVTEQELASTNTTLNKLNEQYSNLSERYNELSEKIENSVVNNDKFEELDARCDTLSTGHNELLGKITTLEINNEELKEQYNELSTGQDELLNIIENIENTTQFRELKEQYDELSVSHNELSVSHNELLERTEVLEKDNETLKTRYNNLSIGHNELLERHNTLSSEHSKLSRKYDELSTKVTSLENFAIGEMEEKYNLLVIKYESLLDRIEELENGYNGGTTVIPCEGITLDKISLSFANNMAQSLTATVTPSNTTDSINWTSSDSTIAIVSNGIVTPIANGNCIITATCGNYSANCSITVDIQSAVVTYAITNNLTNVTTDNSMNSIQENQPYSAILTYPDDYELSQIKVLMNNVDITDSVIEYIIDEEPTNIPCANISLNKTSITFTDNTIQRLVATLTPYDTTDTVIWSSNDNNIATVDNNGAISPIANGICTITATCGNCSVKCYVTVSIDSSDDDIYDNPTVTFDSNMYKAKLTQDGYTEYIDVSCEENTGHADYNSSIELSDGEQTYYLTLLNEDSDSAISRFRINGLVPDIGGWYAEEGGDSSTADDGIYNLWVRPTEFYDANFNSTVNNINCNEDFFEKSLTIYNSMFPALNLTFDSNSINELKMVTECPFGDNYYAVTSSLAATGRLKFSIELYSENMINNGGTYSDNPKFWISVLVHELGHTLGLDDKPQHIPSIFEYTDDERRSRLYYLQPNDVIAFKYLAKKEENIDVVTALEESTGKSYNIEILEPKACMEESDVNNMDKRICCTYAVFDNPEEKSDIVVEANLIFNREERLNRDGGLGDFYFDIYTIEPISIIKGANLLENNKEVKILKYCGIEVDTTNSYKLYLNIRENSPHLLLNPSQGLIKL